jgi:hypothetical protein
MTNSTFAHVAAPWLPLPAVPNPFDRPFSLQIAAIVALCGWTLGPCAEPTRAADVVFQQQEVLGFFHSHPDCPNTPSEFDRQRAYEYYLYIIISVYDGKVKDINGWTLNYETEQFEEAELEFIA